jgi:hypothetical protein
MTSGRSPSTAAMHQFQREHDIEFEPAPLAGENY